MWYLVTAVVCLAGGVFCARKYWGKTITLGNILTTKAKANVKEGEDYFQHALTSLERFLP